MTDEELVGGFEAGSLADFPHEQHVRLTLIYLCRHGHAETLRKLSDGLLRFATAKGHPEKFNVTMTRAWIDLIDAARRAHPGVDDPAGLVGACPQLLDRNALLRFYSRDRLETAEARERWVSPDLAPAIGVDPESIRRADTPR